MYDNKLIFNIKTNWCKNIRLHASGLSPKPVWLTLGNRRPCYRYKSKEIKTHFKSHL